MQIWDGNPSAGGSVIFGDLTTNVMASTEWTNAWRVLESGPDENRPIMAVVADVSGLFLNAGTYWIEYSLGGTGASGPWNPPVTIVGETTTGNAIQNQSGTWVELIDVGPQGIPFVIEGNPGTQPANDVSVSAIVEPNTGVDLTAAEPVVITIKNNGTATQSNIPYEVSWDGPTGAQTVSGTFAGPLAAGETADETLAETADLSAYGNYDFEACTQLAGDEYPDNDCKTKTVSNLAPSLCVDNLYSSGCGFGDGLISWELENISVPDIPCSGSPEWYHDYRDQVHNLPPGDYELTVVAGYATTNFDVWIDFNDDLLLTADELVLDDAACADANVPYTFTLTVPSSAAPGQHVLRFRTNWIDPVLDPCETYTYGNCCDFSAMIGDPLQNDVGVTSIDMATFYEPGMVTPMATVKNFGTDTQSFDVTLTIDGYSSTKNVAGLASGATEQVTFDDWNATEGSYTAEACTELSGDENPNNDCKTLGISVMVGQFVYAYNAYDPSGGLVEGPVTFDLTLPGVVNQIAPSGSSDFIAGGCWAADIWWGIQYGGGLYTIDPGTGDMTLIGTSPDCSGLAFDGTTVYGASITDLYTIDPATGQGTMVGSMGNPSGLMIGIGCNAAGDLFGYDIGDDIFYSIDKGTGAATAVGPLGYDYNYAQDMSFDKANDVCYLSGYTTEGGLYTVDVTTGSATFLGAFQGGAEITGFAIPSAAAPPVGDPPSEFDAMFVENVGVECEWIDPDPALPGTWVGYDDGVNAGGLGLNGGGTFWGTIRWEPADLAPFDGLYMTQFQFYPDMFATAADIKFMIWEGANAGTLVYEQVLTGLTWNDWNTVTLDEMHMVDASTELWIGFEITHVDGENPLGMDGGPAVAGYGDMVSFDGVTFESMATAYGIDNNFNLKAFIADEVDGVVGDKQPLPRPQANITSTEFSTTKNNPTQAPANVRLELQGINIYRDGNLIAEEIAPGTQAYTDEFFQNGTFMYSAKAVYDEGISVATPEIPVTIVGAPEIVVNPMMMNEMHDHSQPVYITTQELTITNNGGQDLEWEATIELDGKISNSQAMDAEEYARLIAQRQAMEGQPTNDVQYGVTPGDNVTNGNHYSKFQGPNGTRDVLYDNGPFVTAEGVGSNGSDYSELQDASLGMGTYGFGVQLSAGNSLSDDFEVTGSWNINTITVYGYQTGSGPPSTITEVYMQIWDGNPSAGGSVVFGDLTTNVMASTEWTNAWRVLESGPDENRPIMAVVADVSGLFLNAGTYWIEYSLGGTGASGPWNPPVTITGETTTGNAIQNQSGTWVELIDVGPQGIPFVIEGNQGAQPADDVSVSAIVEPMSGVELGSAEPITITLKNNGTNAQTSIPWEVSYDGPTGMETFSGTWTGNLGSGETLDVTLTETADLSAFGDYEFEACTDLPGDEFPDNDCKTKMVTNAEPSLCIDNLYSSGCGFGDGLISWDFANINVADIPCSGTPEWYHDYTDQVHAFNAGETYTLTVVAGYATTNFDVWIDWNDDLLLTDDELILDDGACADANVPYTFEITIPADAPGGDHILRFRTNWIDPVLDPCETYTYGNCCDFKANAGGGVTPDGWFTMEPLMGTVAGGDSQTASCTFSSEELEVGTYTGTVMITSNDPAMPMVEVPVTLVVQDEGPSPSLIFEPFEDYAADDYLVQQAVAQGKEYWTTWSENPGSAEDPIVKNDQAYAGSNSVVIEGTNDAVLVLPQNYTAGVFNIDFRVFIPTGKIGYFNALQLFAGTASEWGMQAYFDVGGAGLVDAGGAGAGAFTYTYDTWHHVSMMIDLDNDNAVMYLNGDMIVEWVWSSGSFGTGTLNEFHALNFYAWAENGTPGAYFDDIDIKTGDLPPMPDPPTNLLAVVDGHDVELTWQAPGAFEPQWITYSAEEVTNSIGTNAAAEFDVAARWEPADLAQFENGAVSKINFVPGEPGDICTYTLKVWQGSGTPTLIYDQVLTDIVPDVWNEVTLDTPVPFDNTQELWIGFGNNTTAGYPAGCDDGPQVEGFGNMMFWEGAWVTLTSLNPALTYNWAVQGYIEFAGDAEALLPIEGEPVVVENEGELALNPVKMTPPAIFVPDAARALTYNVYRNIDGGTFDQIATGVDETEYIDMDLEDWTDYCYYVTSVNDEGGESVPSNEECVTIISVNELAASSFSVYPNPTNGIVNIESDLELKSVKLVNLTGQVVYSAPLNGSQFQFNASEYTTGVYTLQIETEAGVAVHKLIIQ